VKRRLKVKLTAEEWDTARWALWVGIGAVQYVSGAGSPFAGAPRMKHGSEGEQIRIRRIISALDDQLYEQKHGNRA
jgi:hypothetical protein